jgi:hypothetical protein
MGYLDDILVSRKDNIMEVISVDTRVDRYEVIEGKIPSNYSIWNANLLKVQGKTYLKLYNNDLVRNYSVNMDTLKALEVSEELGSIIDDLLAGGRNPQEVKEYLTSTDKYIRENAIKIKPYIEELYGVKIAE